jgi:formylglycine-generating enzyme required for sulfatase activity
MNNPQQPREYDAVLGGNSPSIEGAAVLGGIEGVKLRLQNPDVKVRITALEQALNYGEQGLDLVIAGLKDESVEVQEQSYILLNNWRQKQQSLLLISRTQKQQELNSGLMKKIKNFIFNQDKSENMEEEINQYPEIKLMKIVDSALINNVKLRLQTLDINLKIAAMKQALNYGEQGLELVIQYLNDKSWDIQNAAYLILKNRPEPRIKTILQDPSQLGFKLEQIAVVTVNKFGQIIQRQRCVARYFIENLGNDVTLEMVAIPGGTFIMGSPENEERGRIYGQTDEYPQHQVTVPSFFIGKYPVTQAQYEAIMGSNPSRFKGENRPVGKVRWYDAVEFCEKLSQRTGRPYRLSSEAEWEYACRAGTITPFYFGETITTDLVNYNGKEYTYGSAPKGKYREQTTDVGIFPPNAFGLYDMHGNVWEWCQDDWDSNYINAPTDGSALTSQIIRIKVLRGGSWFNASAYCRSARRFNDHANQSNYENGFRVACTAA